MVLELAAPLMAGRNMRTKDVPHISGAPLTCLLFALFAVCLMVAGAAIARLLA